MKREQAIELARWALKQHYPTVGDSIVDEAPHEWVIDALRMAGASGKVEGAELVLQLIRTKGMLATLLDLVRELTETLDNTSNDLEGEAQALVNALLGRAKAALDQADQARLGEFAGKPVGLPECGACPGDGTVCVAACKLQGESPKAEPAHGWHWMSHPSWNSGEPIPVWVFDEDGKLFYRPFADLSTDFEWDRRDPEWRSHGRLAVEQAEA